MSEPTDFEGAEDDIFELPPSDVMQNNKRKAVRYVRPDINAMMRTKGLFGVHETPVDLIDISSKGAMISCTKKLAVNHKITLILSFNDDKTITLSAKVIHCSMTTMKQYGLKFSKTSDELGEQLLSTQNDLIFK